MSNGIFHEINCIETEILKSEGIIEPARKSGYICPFCGNGTGKHGTGLEILRKDNGEYGYTQTSIC